jgi:riboflavin kinase/FMN adenylyltransferase
MTRVRKAAVVPGNHDGVHAGHRALLAEAGRLARERDLDVVALTFDPHPLSVIGGKDRAPIPLTTIPRRSELLRAAGADDVVVACFDTRYAAQSPTEWVDRVLVDELRAAAVVVGPDFKFGAGGGGSLATLRELGGARRFDVSEVEPISGPHGRVSSTRIREALQAGDVEPAAAMLGRVHEVDGTVVVGHRRGRTIGFPTANLDPDPVLMPSDGVYAVIARGIDGARGELLRGVANLGSRPTFAAGRSVEVHLFDFDGDLYGARLRVGFVAFLRAERKFESVEELRAQITSDAQQARARLAREEPTWRTI